MKKYYEVNKHNSTVNGLPGRLFDWSEFDWNRQTKHDFRDMRYSTESEYIPKSKWGKLLGIQKAPCVFVDDYLIADKCQYLHVPYAWSEQATIYRVRPNDSMEAGKVYRGKLIQRQTAVKLKGKWYWCLEF